jgi:lipooligosaccharide transport system ATP-binding protein
MSTHYIEEAQRLADTVTIMSHGQRGRGGPPAELVAEHAGARRSRSTARRRLARSRPTRDGGLRTAAPARRVIDPARRTLNGSPDGERGRRTSRTSSCC